MVPKAPLSLGCASYRLLLCKVLCTHTHTNERTPTIIYSISFKAVHPDWEVNKHLYGFGAKPFIITENKILRLAFHDCAKYTGRLNYRVSQKKEN